MIWLLFADLTLGAIVTTAAPMQGDEVVIEVHHNDGRPRPGETVRVVHRPGLGGEQELAIGITDGLGRVRWTPESPGVAQLRAGDETQRIRIETNRPPLNTLLLLLLLALTSLGALVYALLPAGKKLKAA
ncbi:MAG: hypothetical protein GWP91_14225 [Rhodobacterales bacterium]|nr:hypothetical protein [Rhodobacterales bacterium]